MNDGAKLGAELSLLWDELEEDMGEWAAYSVACEMLGINPDDGHALIIEAVDAGLLSGYETVE